MGDQNPEVPGQSGAVDTHCHLFLMDQRTFSVVEAARAAGVDRLICVGVDPETSRRSLELADSIEGVFATAGMHPHDAERFDDGAGARIEELLHDPRVLGVGECGLDFFRMHSPKEDQERASRRTSRSRTTSASRSWSTSATRGPTSFEYWMRVRRSAS